MHKMQKITGRYSYARLQSRSMLGLCLGTSCFRNEEEEDRQCMHFLTQSIVCEICYERTALDAESIAEL